MKNTLYLAVTVLATASLVGGVATARAMSHEKEIVKISLSPVPAVKAKAGGEAEFTLGKDANAIHYVLRGTNIEDVTMGHIHEVGDNGAPGAILVWLYPTTGEAPSLKAGKTTGILARGDIDAARLSGPMKGGSVKGLFEKLEHGKAGVAVHTKANPGGEIWGYHGGKQPGKKM